MPELPPGKILMHPGKRPLLEGEPPRGRLPGGVAYAEIQVTSNFTFLTGASQPEELVQQAASLGYAGIAVTDTHSLTGVVRMHVAAKQVGLPLAVGCRLEMHVDRGTLPLRVLVYPTSRRSYGNLCELLTRGNLRATKGQCHLTLHDLLDFHTDLLAVALPPEAIDETFMQLLEGLKQTFTDERLSLAAVCRLDGEDRARLRQLSQLASHVGIPLAASNDVQHHSVNRKPVHDVLTCIREGVTLREAGWRLLPNAERHLKSPEQMHALFAAEPGLPGAGLPGAIGRSVAIVAAASAGFSLDELRYEYPHETCPAGIEPMQHLAELTRAGAAQRYPGGVPDTVTQRIEHELKLIDELRYPHYFLTVHDIVRFARGRGILCQGRGAAANSAVCFCLDITEVNPKRIDMLFERFVSRERDEPPDIDVDFEHERREEVIQYLYQKYGRHRAALTAEVISYRTRSAIRDVGKTLGLSLDVVDRLAKEHEWFDTETVRPGELRAMGLNPDDPLIVRLSWLVRQMLGFPRHLSQHVGGFVLTQQPLSRTVPIQNAAMPARTVIEWDKDDIDALGMLKVDVLGLGMLTCVRKCFDLVHQHHGKRYTMYHLPAEDEAVYDMICRADTVGVFQIESRAQMSMLPRLKPRCFYDLVIEVAIVRPGPIQGGMVHPYLRRRAGEEPVVYPSEAVRGVLERTLGVPLFQEQAMALAIKAAGFTAGEADALRRAMAGWKRKGDLIYRFGQRLIEGMIANGYDAEFADRCFEQIKGFSEYGFPESHAASFALIVYVSAWLKCHHPAAFAGALVNSQPMGFYAPAQIVRDAAEHGVEVRPIDVNHSAWDCTLEAVEGDGDGAGERKVHALRLGMRLVKGLRRADAEAVRATVREHGPMGTVEQLWRMSGASARAMRALASADAFGSMGLDRPQARWAAQKLHDVALPLFDEPAQWARREDAVPLPAVGAAMQVVHDYDALGLSLKAHPMAFMRAGLAKMGVIHNEQLQDEAAWPHGKQVGVAGLVLVRQRPSTASGVVFMTLEDETGIANLILRPGVFERFRRVAKHSRALIAQGQVERAGPVVHVMVQRLSAAPGSLGEDEGAGGVLRVRSRDFH